MMIERLKMDDHLSEECPYRQVKCEYCHVTGEHHVIVGQHREQCPKLPLFCPNECGLENISRSELQNHLRKCPLQKVHCKYHSIGCEAKILTGAQDEHDEACMKEHFQLMRNELAHTKEELVDLKLQVGDREYYNKSWAIHHNFLQSKKPQHVEQQHAPVKENHIPVSSETAPSQLDIVSSELCRTQKQFAQWKKQNSFLMDRILATMEWRTRLDILSALTDNPDLEVATPVIIKVTQVETKKEFKMVYKSPAFLTHPNGHKVSLCILPGGNGSHITNFSVHIMSMHTKGNELNGTFTVSLMNQLGDTEHCRTMLKYESNKES